MTEPEFTDQDVLRAIGTELKEQTALLQTMRTSLQFLVFVTVLCLVIGFLIAAGVITLEFTPT